MRRRDAAAVASTTAIGQELIPPLAGAPGSLLNERGALGGERA
jgi:hypothetical protein